MIGTGCHGMLRIILLCMYGDVMLLLRFISSAKGFQPFPSSFTKSLIAVICFSAQNFRFVLGVVPHCMPCSSVRNLFPKRGCRIISSHVVGSCCSIPVCIVFHALTTPCHIVDPCLTRVREFISQLECAGHFPLRDCLDCATLCRTRDFHGSYPTERPLIRSLMRSAEDCHCGSSTLTPPLTMGSTTVSHLTFALAQDSRFPDHI